MCAVLALIPADILGGGGMRFRRSLYHMVSKDIDVKAIIPLIGREMIHIASLKHIYKELKKKAGIRRVCILDLRTLSQRLPILRRTLSSLEIGLLNFNNNIIRNGFSCISNLQRDVSLIYTTENFAHLLLAYRLLYHWR